MNKNLRELEQLLQQIGAHEEQQDLQRVKMSSAQLKQELLQEQLHSVQQELQMEQQKKTKLCESIGILNQKNADQENKIKSLTLDLDSSKQAQTNLLKRFEDLKSQANEQKDTYIKTLEKRTIQVAYLFEKYSKATKMEDNTCLTILKGATEALKFEESSNVFGEQSCKSNENQNDHKMDVVCDIPQPNAPNPITKSEDGRAIDQLKSELNDIKLKNKDLSRKLNELDGIANQRSEEIQVKNNDIAKLEESIRESQKQLELKKSEILQLNEQLSSANLSSNITSTAVGDSTKEGPSNGRIQMLEDNLQQMNGYADLLEMIINQCAPCSQKLQEGGAEEDS